MFCCYSYFVHENTEPQNGYDNGPWSHSLDSNPGFGRIQMQEWQDSNLGSLISVLALSLSKVRPHGGIHIKIQEKKQANKKQEFK